MKQITNRNVVNQEEEQANAEAMKTWQCIQYRVDSGGRVTFERDFPAADCGWPHPTTKSLATRASVGGEGCDSRAQCRRKHTADQVERSGNPSIQALVELKDRLLRQELRRTPDGPSSQALRHAAEEAASLAWATDYPLLLLPTLFQEKVQRAQDYCARQQQLWSRSERLLLESEIVHHSTWPAAVPLSMVAHPT